MIFKQFLKNQSFFDGILQHYGSLEVGISDFFENNFPFVQIQTNTDYAFGDVINLEMVTRLQELRTLRDEDNLDTMMQ